MFATACLFFLWLLIGLVSHCGRAALTCRQIRYTVLSDHTICKHQVCFQLIIRATRGFEDGEADPNITWRNYTLSNFAWVFGCSGTMLS